MGFWTAGLIVAALTCMAAAPASAQPSGLVSPYSLDMPMRRAAAPVRNCKPPPAAMRDLEIESVFAAGDFTHEVSERAARRRALTRGLHAYVGEVVALSDRALLLRGEAKSAASACVLDWLRAWMDNGALQGSVSWPEGEYEREWVSIALGLSLLKLYAGEPVDAPEWARRWYLDVSAGLAERYPLAADSRNNHWYWAGLASMVAGTVAGDRSRYDWGKAQLDAGLADIDPEGFLPLELERGAMSLRYTGFAAGALVVMAAVEQANGRSLTTDQNDDLRRLVHRILSGLADPQEFERLAGKPQERWDTATVRLLAWLEIYHALTMDVAAEPWLRHFRPQNVMWLGGDVTMSFGTRIAPGAIARSPLIGR